MEKDTITKKLLVNLIQYDELNEVLGKTLEFFRVEFDFNSGAFFLFNPSFERIKLEAQFGFSPVFLNSLISNNIEESKNCEFSFFPEEDFYIYENLNLKDIVRNTDSQNNIRYKVLIFSLKDRKIKKGYLWLIKQEPFAIDEDQIELLKDLVNLVSVKIPKAQIHHEMLRTVEQLEKLLNIQNAFLMDLELESIFKRILIEVSNMFNPSIAKLIKSEKNKFIILNNDGEEIEILNNNEQYIFYNDLLHNFKDVRDIKIIENYDRKKDNYQIFSSYEIKSFALLPIFVQNKCEGFLFIGKNISNHFQKEDFPLYVAFSIFSSQAISLAKSHKDILKLQEQLLQAQKMESIGILAGGIAHDFNNALVGVIGSVDLLELEIKSNPKVLKYLRLIKDSAKRMSHWTSQLIAYARGGNYVIESVNLNNVVFDSIGMVYSSFSDKVCFVFNLYPDLFFIEADYNQMNQVITNLVMNSYESITEKGYIHISTINVPYDHNFYEKKQLDSKYSYVMLSIKDNGCGIDENIIDKVFEPFVTTKFQGRGLGLAAVYGIIENLNGKIIIDSKVNIGTTIEIYIPINEIKINNNDVIENSYKKILFFNNDNSLHQILVKELALKGYIVYETSNINFDIMNDKWNVLVVDTSGLDSNIIYEKIKYFIESNIFDKTFLLFNTEEEAFFDEYRGIDGIKLLPKPIDNKVILRYIIDWLSK